MRRIPFVASAAALVLFLGVSALGAGPGLPLDDGWIHQTYARNLALEGELAFVPGTPSAGSTSPLWSVLLAVGHLLRLPALLWAYALGGLALIALVWATMRLWRLLWPEYEQDDWAVGTAVALSWPLVWAAGSGMETLLFMALGFWLLAEFLSDRLGAARMGVLAGLLILARPEGLILAFLAGVAFLIRRQWRRAIVFGAAALLPLLPYFWFNLQASGVLWPNTFYAKQREYAVLLERPLPSRFVELLYFSLGGPERGWRGMSAAHLVLLPGLLLAGLHAWRLDIEQRRLWRLLPLFWAGGHVMAYAMRLPVTYQHGRYLWAALPVWIVFGMGGWGQLLAVARRQGRWGGILARTATMVFATLMAVFLLLGAFAYAQDVAFVENEMVTSALWLRDNTRPDALVAAHDIGAIGYFARRPLLDLAGLITPEVIPLLDNEEALAQYVREQGAEILVTAPGWPYRALTTANDAQLLFETGYAWTRQNGLNNMAIYRLGEPALSRSERALSAEE